MRSAIDRSSVTRAATALFALLLAASLSACAPETQNGGMDGIEQVAAWFEDAMGEDYQFLQCQADGGRYVILAGYILPGTTDTFGGLKLFILEGDEPSFSVVTTEECDIANTAGFTVKVLTGDESTIVFGDLEDSVFDYRNDRRLEADFHQINVISADGTELTAEITKGVPYLVVLEGVVDVADVTFIGEKLEINYSDYYTDGL